MTFEQITKTDIRPMSQFLLLEDTVQATVLTNKTTKLTTPSILIDFNRERTKINKSVLLRHPSSFLEDNPTFLQSWDEVSIIPCLDCEKVSSGQLELNFKEFVKLYRRLTETYI